MPQPNKIPKAFAASGDRNIIPESTGTLGLASWNEGFPAITSVPFAEGGIAPKRADFNGIFNALSAAALWYQQGGVFVYDNATNYEIGNLVIYSGEIYVCKTANGPASALHSPANDNAETYWGRIYPQNGTFDRMFFLQTSGTYTAPYTGVYRITLKGGGGGGGPLSTTTTHSVGTGGGEGGTLIFYVTLIKNQAYSYTIGAGGAAGVNATDDALSVAATSGGDTSITIGGATYAARGGTQGAPSGNLTKPGGAGGGFTIPSGKTAFGIYGQRGACGGYIGDSTTAPVFSYYQPGGGGSDTSSGKRGSGGSGGTLRNNIQPTAGGDGYILIEYAG